MGLERWVFDGALRALHLARRGAARASAPRAIDETAARQVLEEAARRRPREVFAICRTLGLRAPSPDEAVDAVLRAVRRGLLHAELVEHRRVTMLLEPSLAPMLLDAVDDVGDFLEIVLLDDEGNPVPNEPYRIETADGRIRSGTLGPYGRAREEGLTPGSCKVTFPRIHAPDLRRVA